VFVCTGLGNRRFSQGNTDITRFNWQFCGYFN
jgi:hypothetical protein